MDLRGGAACFVARVAPTAGPLRAPRSVPLAPRAATGAAAPGHARAPSAAGALAAAAGCGAAAARASRAKKRARTAAQALTGKVALVTGGGTGIGQGICLHLAKAGATVVACGRTQKTLDQTVEKLSSLGLAGGTKTADVTDEARVQQAVDEVIGEHGSLDILVNNAGIEGYVGPFEDMPVEAYDQLVAANLKSQVLMCRAVIPHMKARAQRIKEEAKSAGEDGFAAVATARPHAGAIVNLSSIAGKRGFPGLAAYSATNWARIGLTQSLALELAEHYITVNAICPGIVWTPIWDNLASAMGGGDDAAEKQKVFQEKVETLIPMKKPQTPDEMGELVAHLVSQPNLTGQSVALDGGYLA